MKIAVLGYGASGKAAEKLAEFFGFEVVIFDEGQKLGCYKADGSADYAEIDEIVVSPGVPPKSALYGAALASGLPMVSEMEFGFRYCDFPLLAVTGTNGKTTTTELTTHLLQKLGYAAQYCGNIGNPLSELVWFKRQGTVEKLDVAVIEVSSFQLEKINNFAPLAAVNLNVTDDHLDRYHGSMMEYSEVKFSIFDRIKDRNNMFLGTMMRQTPELVPEKYKFLLQQTPAIQAADGKVTCLGQPLLRLDETQLRGAHNCENLLAALSLVGAYAGMDKLRSPELIAAVKEFSPGEHRIQVVAQHGGITYINDSKATNPASVLAALEAVGGDHNTCILLGGLDKGMDFSSLAGAAKYIKKAVVLGQCRQKMYDTLKDAFPCQLCETFADAVNGACAAACPGDVVILSPSCASMDMFKNYKERGETFTRLVNEFIKE